MFVLPALLSGGGEPKHVGKRGGAAADVSQDPNLGVDPATSGAFETPIVVTPPPSVIAAEPTNEIYVVKKGDTLSAIAKKNGVTVDQIVCATPLRNPNVLSIGQELVIPPPGYVCPGKGGKTRQTPSPGPSLPPGG
jgi:LysM repeat protein